MLLYVHFAAYPMNANSPFEAEFAYVSGHKNPIKAIAPCLLYEARSASQLQLVTGDNTICSAETNGTVWDLKF